MDSDGLARRSSKDGAMQTSVLRSLRTLSALMLGAMLTAFGTVSETRATVLAVPNALATEEGNSNNAMPFSVSSRYQQVFAASEFSALSGPALITEISFRPDAVFGGPFSATIPSIQISLSTTPAAPERLDGMFANNIGVDNRVVFSGPLFLSSAFTGPAGGPKNFDVVITLQQAFLYKPQEGNLLLDVRNFTNVPPVGVFDPHNLVGDGISRLWNVDVNSNTPLLGSGTPNDVENVIGLVTQFTVTAVPEPAINLFLGAVLLVLAGMILRRRPQA